MRGLRVIVGILFLLAAGFVLGVALQAAGASHGFAELRPERLIEGEALMLSLGAAALFLVGIVVARLGNAAGGTFIGLLFALGGIAVGAYGTALVKREVGPAIPYWAVAFVLVVISTIFLARRKT